MINIRKAAEVAAVAFALGALAAPASAASAPAPSTTHVTFPAGSGTTSASTMPSKATYNPNATIVGAGDTVGAGGGWCKYTVWGGQYYCGSQSWWGISGQLFQVFVIGKDNAVWTRWSDTSGVSGWVSLGGICKTGVDSTHEFQYGNSQWIFATECIGSGPGANGDYWTIGRLSNGSWTGWGDIGKTPVS